MNGRILLHDGLISIKEIEECIEKGNCRKLSIKLPAWCMLQCLLASAKRDSSGLVTSKSLLLVFPLPLRFGYNHSYAFKFPGDDVELTRSTVPRDKVFEWFIGPLLIMKEQLKKLQLDESEEACLRKLVIGCKNENPEDWNDFDYPSSDNVRRAQLQAIIRRYTFI